MTHWVWSPRCIRTSASITCDFFTFAFFLETATLCLEENLSTLTWGFLCCLWFPSSLTSHVWHPAHRLRWSHISDSFRLATTSISLPITISHLDQWPKGPSSFARHHHYCSSCLTGRLGSLLASHSLPHIQPSFENHNTNGIVTAVEG